MLPNLIWLQSGYHSLGTVNRPEAGTSNCLRCIIIACNSPHRGLHDKCNRLRSQLLFARDLIMVTDWPEQRATTNTCKLKSCFQRLDWATAHFRRGVNTVRPTPSWSILERHGNNSMHCRSGYTRNSVFVTAFWHCWLLIIVHFR